MTERFLRALPRARSPAWKRAGCACIGLTLGIGVGQALTLARLALADVDLSVAPGLVLGLLLSLVIVQS